MTTPGDRALTSATRGAVGVSTAEGPASGRLIETIVSPFHCLYQDALWFHSQSQLRCSRSESEASRLARGAFLAYLASAEALVHQAAAEIGRHELGRLCCDPDRPLPPGQVWRLLPAIADGGECCAFDPDTPPWPQFEEMLELRRAWAYPGSGEQRRAYYRSTDDGGAFEPLSPHEAIGLLGPESRRLFLPRTGLPRDPYALRPQHLDTARAILDAAIAGLDRRLGGALTRDARHRKEPIRIVAQA